MLPRHCKATVPWCGVHERCSMQLFNKRCHYKERRKKFQSSSVRGVEIEDFVSMKSGQLNLLMYHTTLQPLPPQRNSSQDQHVKACTRAIVSTRSQSFDFLRLLDCFFHIPTHSSICLGHLSDCGSSLTNHHPHLLLGRYITDLLDFWRIWLDLWLHTWYVPLKVYTPNTCTCSLKQ